MKFLTTIALATILSLAVAATAAAQGGMAGRMNGGLMNGGPQFRGLLHPVVGSGAQYEVQRENGKNVVEIDALGKESVDGKDAYWFETTMFGTPMGDVIIKVLSVPDATGITMNKTIMQMPGHPPMEMPQMGRMDLQKRAVDIRDKADNLGSESVTVPAGTFTADHYRMKDGSGDYWLSDKISPYGLVKADGKDMNVVLLKVVTDAKDQITGTPVPFNPAMMMQGGPRQR